MADYIRTNILSQAYIHVKAQARHTDDNLESIRRNLEEFARSRTDFYLYPETRVEIEFEEGSVKARITVLGTVFLLMQGIANYPDFREGVALAYSDARQLAEYIILEAQYQFGTKHDDVIRIEARTGILTSLRKVIAQLEQIQQEAAAGSNAKDLAIKLATVRNEIDRLMGNLATEGDVALVQEGIAPLIAQIPEVPAPPRRGRHSSVHIAAYREERGWLQQGRSP